jgi:hypothetical protein
MLYALADQSDRIDVVHLDAALALWDYFDRSARFLFGDRIGGPTADKIMDALRAAGDAGMARAEIRREVFHDNVKAHEITRALGMLRSFRMARSESIPRNERTEERWFYVRT